MKALKSLLKLFGYHGNGYQLDFNIGHCSVTTVKIQSPW